MRVNVAYSSSDFYAKCTGISLLSLLKNNVDIKDLDIYLFTTDMSDNNKILLTEIAHMYNRQLIIMDVKEQLEKVAKEYKLPTLGGAYNTYIRLFSSQWLNCLDRVLFIDSDTLVLGSIYQLYADSMEDSLIAAVPDVGVYGKKAVVEDEEIVSSVEKYFNAGILLINLKKWVQEDINRYIANKIKQYGESWWNQEQSILNYSINNRCKFIHLKYNYYTTFHLEDYEQVQVHTNIKGIISKEEYNEATRMPVIIHFIGLPYVRPWFHGSVSPFKELYKEYYDMSPWRELPLDRFPKNPQVGYRIYDYLLYLAVKNGWYRLHNFLKDLFGVTLKKYLRPLIGIRK